MLLVKATIESLIYRFSDRQLKLAHPWNRKIFSVSSTTVKTEYDYGGWCRPAFGTIKFAPDFLPDVWPPPVSFIMEQMLSAIGENGVGFFDGSVYIKEWDESSVQYRLYKPTYDYEVPDNTTLPTTLVDVFDWLCDSSRLNIANLDDSLARSPSPAVSHTTSSDENGMDLASSMAAFFTHLYYVDRATDTLHLIDMESDNGSRSLVNQKVFSPKYSYNAPTYEVTATSGDNDYRRTSAFTFDKSVSVTPYHTGQTQIEDALDRILAILNAPRVELTIPMQADNLPMPGERINLLDKRQYKETNSWIRGRMFTFDIANRKVKVTGEGGIS